ncbi:alpha/beta hydrolase [Planctomycetota bacterium]
MPLHPQSEAFLDAIAAVAGPGWDEMPPQMSREIFSGLHDAFGVGPELANVTDCACGDIGARRYVPVADEVRPAIVYFHGGGWVLGNIDTHDAVCRRLAKESNCVVISVDYRLAPEHPFPAAMDDSYVATRYVLEHAEELGVQAGKIAVAGDSAGGNLAAAVAQRFRDEERPGIDLQVLIYPVIEPTFDSGSYEEFAEDFGLTREAMKFFWRQYAPDGSARDNPYAVPSVARLSRLPRTFVVTAEYDVLRDEGERYAKRLSESGCDVTLVRYDGMLHGFVHFAGAFDEGVKATAKIGRFIKKHLGT